MVYLVADSAEVTVLRSVASTAYGTYTLNVPEGIDLEDIHQFDAPGNQLGYVSTLTKRRVGRFFRRFIRADVSVTAANPADPDWVADSDIDAVLREAEERVSGDFFLESDITLAGLGSWRPFVDFNIGDIVNVEIWGQAVQLPVTRIEPIVSDHTIVDWRVHVGGQLINDDDARIAENQVIYRALVEDRRDLAGLSKQVTQAVDSASRAESNSEAAIEATEVNRDYIDEKLEEAREFVGLGREYLESIQRHIAAGVSSSALVTQFVSEASQYALRAEEILAGLDPLRDDVIDIHGDVAELGEAAKQLAAQAEDAVQQAIAKLAEADGKLAEADQKLQEQIDILDASQRLLAQATQALTAGLAHAAQAAQSALMAADDAGKAAGSALDAAQSNTEAIDAMEDTLIARQETIDTFIATQEIVNAEQTELINQINAQQDDLVRMQNEGVNTIIATSAGTSFPGVSTRASSDGFDWEFTIPDTKGALAKIEFWNMSQVPATHVSTQIGSVGTSGQRIRAMNDMFVQVTWAKPKAIQRIISELNTTSFSPVRSEWTSVTGISVIAANRASQGYLTVKVRWNEASRGAQYGIRLLVNGVATGQKISTTIGPLSFLGEGTVTQTVNIPNVTVPAGRAVQVQVMSGAIASSARRVTRVELSGSWIETQ